ncbi:Os08g0530600, partial [Oryza sativa Japonica Group]
RPLQSTSVGMEENVLLPSYTEYLLFHWIYGVQLICDCDHMCISWFKTLNGLP